MDLAEWLLQIKRVDVLTNSQDYEQEQPNQPVPLIKC